MAFKKLGGLIPQRLKQNGVEQSVRAARILEVANEVIDELYGKGTSEQEARAVALKYGRLQVATMNAALRQELTGNADEIQGRVNNKIGQTVVKGMQVII